MPSTCACGCGLPVPALGMKTSECAARAVDAWRAAQETKRRQAKPPRKNPGRRR